MLNQAQHAMLPETTHDEDARLNFVLNFRSYLAARVMPGNTLLYGHRAEPAYEKKHGRKPQTRREALDALMDDNWYQFWSAMQRGSQEMMWEASVDSVERDLPRLIETAKRSGNYSSLVLDPNLEVPSYITNNDIHLMPGGYHTDQADDDVTAGVLFDLGIYLYSMGALGPNMDGLGHYLIHQFQTMYPGRTPRRILDMGCTTGASTVAWAQTYPDAEICAIDVAAPCLRFAQARANDYGAKIAFSQQNAEHTNFGDGSFDLIISHIALHETSRTAVDNILAESRRLLEPGGLMFHLDLPQPGNEPLVKQALMSWEIHNNNENFYGELRDLDYDELLGKAGFEDGKFGAYQPASTWDDGQTPYTDDGINFSIIAGEK